MAGLAALVGLTLPGDADAAEGASSNYFPGSYGDFLVATAPDPGWIYQNYNMFYDAEVNQAVLQGRVNADIDTFSYANMSAALYTFKGPVFGATFAMGAYLPVVYVDLESSLVGQNASDTVDDSVTGMGDITLMPASFYWSSGSWDFNLENDDTDYETGDEVHVDVMLNRFLSETFALGLKGYYYKQVSVTASWLHDLDATRRLESDYLVVTLIWVLGQ